MKNKDPQKVTAIYNAALKLVMQHGLASLTMAAIGKEAQIGMGTIYVYFKSKEILINELFKHLKRTNTNSIYNAVDLEAPFLKTLKQLFHNYIKNRIERYEEHYFLEQAANSPFLDELAKELDAQAYKGIFQLLEKGKEELLVKKTENPILTAHLMGGINEIVRLSIIQKNRLSEAMINEIFEISWDSIKR